MNAAAGLSGIRRNSGLEDTSIEGGIFSGPSPGLSSRLKTSNMTVDNRTPQALWSHQHSVQYPTAEDFDNMKINTRCPPIKDFNRVNIKPNTQVPNSTRNFGR